MSLIKCPECGREVSTKAPYCLGCGVPILNNVKRCPICNELVLMDAEECPKCHARFIVKKQTEPTGSVVLSNPEPLPDPVTPPPSDDDTDDAVQEPEEEPTDIPSVQMPTDGTIATPPQKPGSSPWWLLLIAILVVAGGVFYYYEYQQHEKTEEADYERLQGCTEQDNYQDFINRYPESSHINNVRARLEELQRIEKEWAEICRRPDQELLQQFLDNNPSSVHKAEAIHKIDSLDWREADRKGTESAYALYIGRHENGEYIDQAYVARNEAKQREAQARRDSIEAAQAALQDSISLATTGIPAAQ